MTIKTFSIELVLAAGMVAGPLSANAKPAVNHVHGTQVTALTASKPSISGLPTQGDNDWHGPPILRRPPSPRGPGFWPERRIGHRRYHRRYPHGEHGHIVPPYTGGGGYPGNGWQIPRPRPK